MVVFNVGKDKVSRYTKNCIFEGSLAFLYNQGILVLLDYHFKFDDILILFVFAYIKNLLVFFGLEDELRLHSHVIISLYLSDEQFVVILAVFVLMGDIDILN